MGLFLFIVLFVAGVSQAGPVATRAPSTTPEPSAAAATAGQPGSESDWLAKVGDETITKLEFEHDMAYRLKVYRNSVGQEANPDKQFRIDTLNELINGRVLMILAHNAAIDVSEADVDGEVAKGKAALGNPDAYREYLRQQNQTEDTLRSEVRQRMITERFIAEKTQGVAVSDDEVTQTCQDWEAKGKLTRTTPTVDIEHILIKANPADEKSWDEGKKRIENARARIAAGEPFEKVARAVSEDTASKDRGGLYYESANGQTLPEIEARMNKLAPGELSEPFRSHTGWHLLKVLAKNEPGQIPCEKVQQRIRDFLTAQKKQAVVAQLVDDARKIVNIEFNKASPIQAASPPTPPVPAPPIASPAVPNQAPTTR